MVKLMSKAGAYSLTLLLAVMTQGCGRSAFSPQAGELYSIKTSDGPFRVIKVLASDRDNVYVCMYQNTYASRPESVAPSDLTLGQPQTKYFASEREYRYSEEPAHKESAGYPLIYFPREEVVNLQPALLGRSSLTAEDLTNLDNYQKLQSKSPR